MISEIIDLNPAKQVNWFRWSDWAGMVASIGCAIHCAAMPFVIAYLPALGLSFLADEAFHKWMAIGCFAIALMAFVPGLRKHGRWSPVAIGCVGLAMITVAAFGFSGECCAACNLQDQQQATADGVCDDDCCPDCASKNGVTPSTSDNQAAVRAKDSGNPSSFAWFVPWLTPIGGMVLVSAHLMNHRFGCSCACCGTDAAMP